jgi:predicted Rossmann-fold nucleotide-binding protein
VVLFGKSYWKGLVDWLRGTMLAEGKISPGDMDLAIATDDIEECVRYIVAAREKRARAMPAVKA